MNPTIIFFGCFRLLFAEKAPKKTDINKIKNFPIE